MNKSTSSIARRLNFSWSMKKLGTYLSMDILVIICTIFGWCYYTEMENFQNVEHKIESRMISFEQPSLDSLVYEIEYIDEKNNVVCEEFEMYNVVFVLSMGMTFILVIQFTDVLGTLFFGVIDIRRKLKPLDDIAKRAEELSRIAFDESKYTNLENAIEHFNPDSQETIVRTGNKDLEGVEIAINNLLARMRDSYRQQSRFVSDASHELRTPIAVIQGYANMLDRWGKEDEKVLEESIEAIKHESEHMKILVEQLLFLARGDAGRNKLEMQQISLKSIIREVYEESKMIDEKHFYELIEDKGDVVMTGDAAMIKQSVRILVDNAAKYTADGEDIILKSGINREMQPYFSIQDNGIGMNDEEVTHVFERFYRSDDARNRQSGGTGLGLSIAKWIIDKHNGYFDVLSRPDIGTRFTVTFK